MGWLTILAMAAIAFAALWRFGRLPRAALELAGAALLLGIAGYAWQGSPGLAGQPKAASESHHLPDDSFTHSQEFAVATVGSDADILTAADGLHQRGLDAYAIAVIRAGLNKHPRSADLWVGLGNALTIYGDGMVSPAARLAFQRAADIQPNHPGPPFFLGLAMLQAGQPDQAERVWTDLLARSPADAPWRGEIEQKLQMLRTMRAAQGGMPAGMGR